MERFVQHPWSAIEDGYIWTLDSIDLRNPVKQFPNEPWLREVSVLWLRSKLFACPKSRRMKMSWLMCWLHEWLSMTNEGARVYFQSETEKKSDELIQRCEFMYHHIPRTEIVLPKLYRNTAQWCKIIWPGLNSQIEGVAQGPNQLRQYTGSAYLGDEIAFWEQARKSMAATKPIAEGGGRITYISSAQRGPFRDVVFDEVDKNYGL